MDGVGLRRTGKEKRRWRRGRGRRWRRRRLRSCDDIDSGSLRVRMFSWGTEVRRGRTTSGSIFVGGVDVGVDVRVAFFLLFLWSSYPKGIIFFFFVIIWRKIIVCSPKRNLFKTGDASGGSVRRRKVGRRVIEKIGC